MENTADISLRTTGIFKVPVDVMWKAWTDPAQIVSWWGPDGFTSTIHEMDLAEGGEWKLTLHGPDGTNYPNRSVFKEIRPMSKIVFEHFNPHFIATIIFEDRGHETRIEWIMLFDTPEMYQIMTKAHKADEGQKQNMERLKRHLEE